MSVASASAVEWVANDNAANIAYFLFPTPPRIERYDLTGERWLDAVTVPARSAGLRVDGAGMYVIAGPTLYRIPLDGGAATPLYTADREIRELQQDDQFIFLSAAAFLWSIRKSDGKLIDKREYHHEMSGLAIAPRTRRLFAWSTNVSPTDQQQVSYAADGHLGAQIDGPYHGDFATAQRNWVFGDQMLVATDYGAVFAADDLFYLGSLAGPMKDLVEAGSTTVVLRERLLVQYSSHVLEVGRKRLSTTAKTILFRAPFVIAFAPTVNRPSVEKVALTDIVPLVPATPPQPETLVFTPDAIVPGGPDDVYLLSTAHRAIYRWSISAARYVDSIGFVDAPEHMAYSGADRALLLTYQSGRITKVSVDDPVERSFAALYGRPTSLAALDPYVLANVTFSSRRLFDGEGQLLWWERSLDAGDPLWIPSLRRVFSVDDHYLNWFDLSLSGEVVDDDSLTDNNAVASPLRANRDGTRLFVPPRGIYSTQPVARIAALPIDVLDSAWSAVALFTLRKGETGSIVERWTPDTLTLESSKRIVGTPLALVALDDDVLAITLLDGRPRFELGSAAADFDQDDVPDSVDNCRDVPNKDQRDLDADGRGDVCDAFPVDIDDDSVLPDIDNCPLVANQDQSDADHDQLGDACDPYPARTDNLDACRGEMSELEPLATSHRAQAAAAQREYDSLTVENAELRLGARWCPGDVNIDGTVTVDEVVVAVAAALEGCNHAAPKHAPDAPSSISTRQLSYQSDLTSCLSARTTAMAAIETADAAVATLAGPLHELRRENQSLRQAANCAADTDADATITVDEVIGAVDNALEGCGPTPTPVTPQPTSAPSATPPHATATATPSPGAPTRSPTPTATLRPAGTPSEHLPFGAVHRYGVGRLPRSVAVADLNNDRRADIATANFLSNDVSLLFSTREHSYAPERRLPVGDGPRVVRFDDLNRDGNLDLVTLNIGRAGSTSSLSVFLGMSGGEMSPERRTPLPIAAIDLEVGQFDSDSFPDLLIGYAGLIGALNLHRGNGDGTFGDAEQLQANPRIGSPIAVGDVNNDGRVDAVSLGEHRNASVLLNNGAEGFTSHLYPLVPNGVLALALADLDGDSTQDLLHLTQLDSAGRLYHYLGLGDGNFVYAGEASLGYEPQAIVAADFNDDGALDVASADLGSDSVTVLTNPGSGAFGEGVCIGVGQDPQELAAADVDDDGAVDLVVALGSGSVAVIAGRGDGSFAVGDQVPVSYSTFAATAADFDQDGHPDLAAAATSGQTFVYFGDGERRFRTSQALSADFEVRSLATGDVDGDGRFDLVATTSDGWGFWRNRTDREFEPAKQFKTGREVSGVALADLNADGILDVVTANQAASDVSVMLGTGGGSFQPQQRFRVGELPLSIAVVDVDHDGRLDLLAMNKADYFSILFGDGAGGFLTEKRIALPENVRTPASMVVVDFNRDGFPDVAATTIGETDSAFVMLSDQHSGYTVSAVIPLGSFTYPTALDAADINSDGYVDLVIARRFDFDPPPNYPPIPGQLSIFLGRPNGEFTNEQALGLQTATSVGLGCISGGANPAAVHVVDLDGNGTPDIVTANGGSHDLTILYGSGQPQ